MKLKDILLEMPEVYRDQGISLKIYFNDTDRHNLPHVHAQYQGQELIISLVDGEPIEGGLPGRQKRFVLRLVKDQMTYLRQKWNEYNPNRQI